MGMANRVRQGKKFGDDSGQGIRATRVVEAMREWKDTGQERPQEGKRRQPRP